MDVPATSREHDPKQNRAGFHARSIAVSKSALAQQTNRRFAVPARSSRIRQSISPDVPIEVKKAQSLERSSGRRSGKGVDGRKGQQQEPCSEVMSRQFPAICARHLRVKFADTG